MPHERSQGFCWTCRVRKKKCDEKSPICWACQSRGLPCHGYGPKPHWMDGGLEEKKEIESLKRAVKENLKQKKALRSPVSPFSQPPDSHGFIRSEPINTSSPQSTYGDRASHDFLKQAPKLIPTPPISINPCINTVERQVSSIQHECYDPQGPLAKDYETSLLMNYLDHVFPLQFSCYTPPAVEFGRGWLLSLLTRTEPLYHAALALSCLYMHSVLLKTKPKRSQCMNAHWDSMNRYHALAFQELQEQISASNGPGKVADMKENIEILACVVQLISFELLRGVTDSWPIHLAAASSIAPRLMAARETCPGTASSIERVERGDRFAVVNEIASDFLIGVSVWFDILGSASTRSKHLFDDNIQYLHGIKLEKVMGCESSVMILIARISQLEQWKREMQRARKLSIVELSSRGSDIEKSLKDALAAQIPHPWAEVVMESPMCKQVSTITRIFAYAALTYLHTVISGSYPELPEIKASVSMTIAAFNNLPEPKLLQNLVWPFCITGCMSSRDQDTFFRKLLEGLAMDKNCLGNCWKAFEVIQECWRLREEQGEAAGEVDWTSAMSNLGFQVLLV